MQSKVQDQLFEKTCKIQPKRKNKNIYPRKLMRYQQDSYVHLSMFRCIIYDKPLIPAVQTTLEDKATRLATFSKHHTELYHDIDTYAENGLYCTGPDRADSLRCFSCKVSLKHWGDADPLLEHVRFSPACTYMRSKVGDEVMDHLNEHYSKLPKWNIDRDISENVFISVKFSDEEARKTSLAHWSDELIIYHIAKQGFYRSIQEPGDDYSICCAYCNTTLRIDPLINIRNIQVHHKEGCPMMTR